MPDGGDLPLEAWMGRLPPQVMSRSFSELALPGAHNAGARSVLRMLPETMERFATRAVGRNPLLNFLARAVADIAPPFVESTAVCQNDSITKLLRSGVRVLDLRVGLCDGEVYICHAVVCDITLRRVLQEVASFLRAQEEEVVALLIKRDHDHPRFDTQENWAKVQAWVSKWLGTFLVTDRRGLSLPMSSLLSKGQRALVLIDVPQGVEQTVGLPYNRTTVESSWRDETKSVKDMLKVLDEWRRSGRMQACRGRLKLLEVALPGNPASLAGPAQAAFRRFIHDCNLNVGTKLDFPDEATVRAIIMKNWEVRGESRAGDHHEEQEHKRRRREQ